MEWKYECHFGDKLPEEAVEGDHISAIEYDPTGQYLAVGDKAGRITVLERKRNNANKKEFTTDYRQHLLFQSHEPEFDYLKSVEIEEKINQIKWLPRCSAANMILTTNDKTVKLWKMHGYKNAAPAPNSINGINPVKKSLRRSFENAHAYHINSISLSSDAETFLSADDLRVNIWHLEHKDSWNVVDIKPPNMEDLSEVITSSSFHPKCCSLFLYSTSKGSMKMIDLRQGTYIQDYCKVFELEEEPNAKTFFTEIISSVSDSRFSSDGRYILSRDYMTLKIWDVQMERKPLKVINIHEALRGRLCDLYENDCIFDKFTCCWSHDAKFAFTGSYKNNFKVCDVSNFITCAGQKSPPTKQSQAAPNVFTFEAVKNCKNKTKSKLPKGFGKFSKSNNKNDDTYDKADFSRKVLYVASHPSSYELSVAVLNSVLVFSLQ